MNVFAAMQRGREERNRKSIRVVADKVRVRFGKAEPKNFGEIVRRFFQFNARGDAELAVFECGSERVNDHIIETSSLFFFRSPENPLNTIFIKKLSVCSKWHIM